MSELSSVELSSIQNWQFFGRHPKIYCHGGSCLLAYSIEFIIPKSLFPGQYDTKTWTYPMFSNRLKSTLLIKRNVGPIAGNLWTNALL